MVVGALLGLASLTAAGQSLQPTVLYSFPEAPQGPCGNLAVGLDGNVYGTTPWGGTNGGFGTFFQINTNGTVTTILSFGPTNANPYGGLVAAGTNGFYGVSANGGVGYGTLFQLSTNGSSQPPGPYQMPTNWGLLSVEFFYGTTPWYTGFFKQPMGANPYGVPLSIGNAVIGGTTYTGGTNGGYGTIFGVTEAQEPVFPIETLFSFSKTMEPILTAGWYIMAQLVGLPLRSAPRQMAAPSGTAPFLSWLAMSLAPWFHSTTPMGQIPWAV
jgi:hypothetical protein